MKLNLFKTSYLEKKTLSKRMKRFYYKKNATKNKKFRQKKKKRIVPINNIIRIIKVRKIKGKNALH